LIEDVVGDVDVSLIRMSDGNEVKWRTGRIKEREEEEGHRSSLTLIEHGR